MSLEAPRQPVDPREIATQTAMQRMGDVLHQRGLGETMVLFGKDGLTHVMITPSHPLPTTVIPHPVVHLAIAGRISGESILFVKEIETVDSSVIAEEAVAGFPPVEKAHLEKRVAIGDGAMQPDTLIQKISGYLDPMFDISAAA